MRTQIRAEPERASVAPAVVYVLQLEHGKYYVGRCAKSRLGARMQEHMNTDGNRGTSRGAEWTRR